MKFTYYSKKSTTAGVCFFTIRTDNDDEQLRINTLTRKYEMYTLLNFDCEVGVFDESITNIHSARKIYNQIKQEAKNLKEDELVQRYYFTDEDGEEVWECFATPEEAYNKAKELANEYNSDICINTVIGEDIVDFACPDDEPETEEDEFIIQRYYFTNDSGEKVYECWATFEELCYIARYLANDYNSIIYATPFGGEEFVYSAIPDDELEAFSAYESETEEVTLEVPAPVEETEQPDDVDDPEPEYFPPDYSEVPPDMCIKELCFKCKHLESCFCEDRSKVLEELYIREFCDDVCGLCSLCCKHFESRISKEELFSLLDDDLPF